MEIIDSAESIKVLKENTVIGTPILKNSKVMFHGKGNILYCEDGITLANSVISFNGSNSIIFLGRNRNSYYLNLTIYHHSALYMGKNNYFNGKININVSEQKHVIIGDDCLFSFDCWIRTADGHSIYDAHTKKRLNPSKSIYIGDHVWIGQHAFILKGSQIGSGSIIGGFSVVSGKTVESNSAYAGNPAKKISESIFFTKDSVHAYMEEDTLAHNIKNNDNYIYTFDQEETMSFSVIEKSLNELKTASEKLNFIKSTLYMNQKKNRFYVGKTQDKSGFMKRLFSRKNK